MSINKKHTPIVLTSVNEIKQIKKVYKYLTFESAVKMLSSCNVRFTRADLLNDDIDLTPSKFNFDYIRRAAIDLNADPEEWVKKAIDKHSSVKKLGICSFGTSYTNKILWERYATSNDIQDGICIEMNLDSTINCLLKKGIKAPALKVRYFTDIEGYIPYELWVGDENEKHLATMLLLATKNKAKWEDEKEVRLFLPQELSENYMQISIYKSCITNVYFGCDTTEYQKNIIEKILSEQKYKIKSCCFHF